MPADEYPPSFVQHRFRLPIESRVWITAVWIIAVWITAVWITTGQLLAAVCYCCVLQDAFAMCMYSMSFSNNMCVCHRHPESLRAQVAALPARRPAATQGQLVRDLRDFREGSQGS